MHTDRGRSRYKTGAISLRNSNGSHMYLFDLEMSIVTYNAKVSSRFELGNCAPNHGSILDGTVTLAANGGDNRRAAIGNDTA